MHSNAVLFIIEKIIKSRRLNANVIWLLFLLAKNLFGSLMNCETVSSANGCGILVVRRKIIFMELTEETFVTVQTRFLEHCYRIFIFVAI